MSKLSCNVVRDLLPNYSENLTSEETNGEIQKHLEECEECTELLKNIEEGRGENIHENKRDVRLFKKLKKRINKKVITVIIICAAAFFGYCVLTQIPLKRLSAEDFRIVVDNFEADSENVEISEEWCEGGSRITRLKMNNLNGHIIFLDDIKMQEAKKLSVFAISIYSDYHIRYFSEETEYEGGTLYIKNVKTTVLDNKSKVSSAMVHLDLYSDEINPEYKDITRVVVVNPDKTETVVWTKK